MIRRKYRGYRINSLSILPCVLVFSGCLPRVSNGFEANVSKSQDTWITRLRFDNIEEFDPRNSGSGTVGAGRTSLLDNEVLSLQFSWEWNNAEVIVILVRVTNKHASIPLVVVGYLQSESSYGELPPKHALNATYDDGSWSISSGVTGNLLIWFQPEEFEDYVSGTKELLVGASLLAEEDRGFLADCN